MEAIFVQDLRLLDSARDEILRAPVLGIDTETTGFDPLTEELRLIQVATRPDKAFIFNVRELNEPDHFRFLVDILGSTRVKCFQNAKFDLKFLTTWLNQGPFPIEGIYDTMIASKLIGRGDARLRHGLGDIAWRELGILLDKTLQKSDFGATDLSESQLLYAARDATVLLDIRDVQLERLRAYQLERVAKIEFDAVATIADTELNGIYLDAEEWTTRIDKQTESAADFKAEILEILTPAVPIIDLFGDPVINIDSPQQLAPALRKLGIPVEDSVDEMALMALQEYPVVGKLLEYREEATALKKFGLKYLDFIHPKTGRIHANFSQLTAPSGRMSCSKPNLQQVPRDEMYRHCVKAQSVNGHIITADYSQVELRIMAQQSGDPALVRAFNEGKDLHTYTASLVFNVPYDQVEPEQRRISKNLNFGTAYGVGPPRFAEQAKIPLREAETALRNFWSVYKRLDVFLKQQGSTASDRGYAKTSSGRTINIFFDPQDQQAYASAKRLGRNFGVQGTGADILKLALYKLRRDALSRGVDVRVINIVHDEIVVETVDDPDLVTDLMRNSMIDAGREFLDPIPCTVGIKAAKTWQK